MDTNDKIHKTLNASEIQNELIYKACKERTERIKRENWVKIEVKPC